MASRYGIHTIELFCRLSRKWFNKVFDTLQSAESGNFYRDETYHSDTGMEKHISTAFSTRGVVIYLYRQKRSKNKTGKNLACFIRFRLNPLSLINGHYQPKGVFQAEKSLLNTLDKCMKDLLR